MLVTSSGTSPLKYQYIITEVNNRTDFMHENYIKMNGVHAMSVGKNSRVKFAGPGLYHFRIELLDKSVSFCDLKTEFIVYVDKAPLPQHIMHIVRASAVSLFAGIIFCVFLCYFYFRHDDDDQSF